MARRRIETDIDINAPAARIWALLADFARMPSWNPYAALKQEAELSIT